MKELVVTQAMKEIAQRATTVLSLRLRETELFEVFQMPEKFKQFCLFLAKEGKTFPKDMIPEDVLVIPVDINDREGYLLPLSLAHELNPEA
jgi:hypothetical protein